MVTQQRGHPHQFKALVTQVILACGTFHFCSSGLAFLTLYGELCVQDIPVTSHELYIT